MYFISGRNRNQQILLPDSIDDYVDDNNSVRVIEAYINSLNLADLGFANPQPHDTGRPMYDPKDLLKLYVYGYMNKIRSSRRLETETKRNLEVIWLLGMLSPDHKTIARFRHDNVAALKNVFRDFVKLCMKLNLYGKELVAIDGSKFKAVNSKDRNFTDKKLQERIARIDAKIEEYLRELDNSDSVENVVATEKSSEEITHIIRELVERKELYQAYADELAFRGESQKSLTDTDSRLMMANGKLDVCYNVQTAVDSKNKLIAEFGVTTNATDTNQIMPMAEKAKDILETDKITAVVDAGYTVFRILLPVWNKALTFMLREQTLIFVFLRMNNPARKFFRTRMGVAYISKTRTSPCVRWGKFCILDFIKNQRGMAYFIITKPVDIVSANVRKKFVVAATMFQWRNRIFQSLMMIKTCLSNKSELRRTKRLLSNESPSLNIPLEPSNEIWTLATV